jgi:hypothetical protein
MKGRPIFIALALSLLAHVARAQSYSIDWFTVDSGGDMALGRFRNNFLVLCQSFHWHLH